MDVTWAGSLQLGAAYTPSLECLATPISVSILLGERITFLVKHGPYVSCLTARARANLHWKTGLSSTFLEFPTAFFSRVKGPYLTRTVIRTREATMRRLAAMLFTKS